MSDTCTFSIPVAHDGSTSHASSAGGQLIDRSFLHTAQAYILARDGLDLIVNHNSKTEPKRISHWHTVNNGEMATFRFNPNNEVVSSPASGNLVHLGNCPSLETFHSICDISPAFDCAVEDEIIIKNPVQSKRLLINTDKGDHHKAIPPELMKHVRKHMDSLPRRERCIVALLCYTGLRFEEILGLQWNDIDLEAREIKIQRAVVHPTRNQPLVKLPKTKASLRTIPLADKLVEHLMSFEHEGFILGGEKPLTYQQKKMAFEKIRERLGLEGYSAHDFRHTCATEWKEHGMTLQEVSKLLGHTNTSVTERCYVEFRKHGMNKARMVMNTI